MNEPTAETPAHEPPDPELENKPTTLQISRKALLLTGALVLLTGLTVYLVDRSPRWGDNGFPVASEDLDRRWLERGGARDLVPALTDPPLLSIAEAEVLKYGRKPMLLATDRVLGVVHEGKAVCIPARVMNWHEVLNLTVGETELALTFSPLGDVPRAFVRDGFELGHSGLLYCSNPLLYDSGPRPSLWSQLDGRARSGPRRGETLPQVPVELAQWGDWIARYPETQFARPRLEERGKFYRLNSYGPYLRSEEVRFAAPEAPPGLTAKERVLVVEAGGQRLVYPVARVVEQLELDREPVPGEPQEGRWTTEQGGQQLTFVVRLDASQADPHCVRVEAPAKLVCEGLWFALSAFDPELKLAP